MRRSPGLAVAGQATDLLPTIAPARQMLIGREPELAALGSCFRSAADGHGSALVIFGEAGIGKSALVDHALRDWPNASVLRSTGSEFEVELPYAALQQFCAGILDYRMKLPRVQRQVLEYVCGLGPSAAGGAYLVGLASLGLLSQASGNRPVICVVDDAHWVDAASAQALAFIARRIEHERVALVFVLRDPSARPELADIDRLAVGRLDDAYAHILLSCAFDGPVDGDVSERLVAEAQGNPLALIELPRTSKPGELAGGYSGLRRLSPSESAENSFRRQAAELAPDARTLLCLAAAEPLGDPRLLRCAARELGLGASAIDLAEASGLITLAHRVRFRHPLARSAVYRGAEPPALRRVHAALAAVTDPIRDPDRKAWHQSLASVGTDEEVAADLERSADRAQDRGGLAAAAAFLERAADLSPDPARRARRALAAAEFRQLAGNPEAARGLLERACRGPLDLSSRGRAKLLRAMLAYQATQNSHATALLLDAARELEPDLARQTYLRALNLARFVERRPGRLVALAQQVGVEAPVRNPPCAVDRLLDALVAQLGGGPVTDAIETMRPALAAILHGSSGGEDDPRWIELGTHMAFDLYDDHALRELANRQVRLARQRGALSVLGPALKFQCMTRCLIGGDLVGAAESVAEARSIDAATGSIGLLFADLTLAAWKGDGPGAEAMLRNLHDRVERAEPTTELYARSILYNGLARYELAYDAGRLSHEAHRQGNYVHWQTAAEFVEAAARLGRPEQALDAVVIIEERAQAGATDWAIGIAREARALVTDDPAGAEALYREAIERLSRTAASAHLARARLVFGEWLRREHRRVEAREVLLQAHHDLQKMTANGFAARAARELRAIGEHPRARHPELMDELTAQERQIARHVAAGATSKEIAAQLFLSPRTIDAHLRSIFRKLGLTSRRQLRGLEF